MSIFLQNIFVSIRGIVRHTHIAYSKSTCYSRSVNIIFSWKYYLSRDFTVHCRGGIILFFFYFPFFFLFSPLFLGLEIRWKISENIITINNRKICPAIEYVCRVISTILVHYGCKLTVYESDINSCEKV